MINQEEVKILLELLTIEQSRYAQKNRKDMVNKLEVIKQKINWQFNTNTLNVTYETIKKEMEE